MNSNYSDVFVTETQVLVGFFTFLEDQRVRVKVRLEDWSEVELGEFPNFYDAADAVRNFQYGKNDPLARWRGKGQGFWLVSEAGGWRALVRYANHLQDTEVVFKTKQEADDCVAGNAMKLPVW